MLSSRLCWVCRLVTVASLVASSYGRFPEVDVVYFGTVQQDGVGEISPKAGETIVLEAKLDGATISSQQLDVGSGQFVLKIPMDDGEGVRLPGTARKGERVRIYLVNRFAEKSFEVVQSSSGAGVLLPQERGSVNQENFRIAGDVSGADPALVDYSGFMELFGVDPKSSAKIVTADSDNDGFTNFEEFIVATNPLEQSEGFRLLGMEKDETGTRIQFGPVRSNRVYTLWGSTDLTEDGWVRIGEYRALVDSPSFSLECPEDDSDCSFFKVGVERL